MTCVLHHTDTCPCARFYALLGYWPYLILPRKLNGEAQDVFNRLRAKESAPAPFKAFSDLTHVTLESIRDELLQRMLAAAKAPDESAAP